MLDEDRIEEILQNILATIKPDQGHAGFWNIVSALEQAYSFQLALVCPVCRRKMAKRLKAQIPIMMACAAQLQQEAGTNPQCKLH